MARIVLAGRSWRGMPVRVPAARRSRCRHDPEADLHQDTPARLASPFPRSCRTEGCARRRRSVGAPTMLPQRGSILVSKAAPSAGPSGLHGRSALTLAPSGAVDEPGGWTRCNRMAVAPPVVTVRRHSHVRPKRLTIAGSGTSPRMAAARTGDNDCGPVALRRTGSGSRPAASGRSDRQAGSAWVPAHGPARYTIGQSCTARPWQAVMSRARIRRNRVPSQR